MELLNGFDEDFKKEDITNFTGAAAVNFGVSDSDGKTTASGPETLNNSFPDPEEEDWEWLMDESVFPPLDSCLDMLSDDSNFMLNNLSPISVLDSVKTDGDIYNHLNVTTSHPKGTRSKKRVRRTAGYGDLPSWHCTWPNRSSGPTAPEPIPLGRRCQHCLADKTPQWRTGPMGPKTLCNACGVRYKSGRLHPEYRPACSPTFSSVLHSNSHKKVMEMRMKKHGIDGGFE